jgi:hypothetical protein
VMRSSRTSRVGRKRRVAGLGRRRDEDIVVSFQWAWPERPARVTGLEQTVSSWGGTDHQRQPPGFGALLRHNLDPQRRRRAGVGRRVRLSFPVQPQSSPSPANCSRRRRRSQTYRPLNSSDDSRRDRPFLGRWGACYWGDSRNSAHSATSRLKFLLPGPCAG